jgi:hypothetical protein
MYIRCIYCIFGRDIIRYTVIYGVNVRFWSIRDTVAITTGSDIHTNTHRHTHGAHVW